MRINWKYHILSNSGYRINGITRLRILNYWRFNEII